VRVPTAALLVTWEGGGNVAPLLVLASELVRRGHPVRVLGPPGAVEGRYRRAGIAYRATDSAARWSPEAQRSLAGEVAAEVHRVPTDVAVVDYMQPAALSGAEAAGVPVVAFVHTLYARQAIADHSPIHMAADAAGVNELRAGLGLPPVDRLPDLLDRAALVLVTTLEALDRPEGAVPGNVRYVGPLVEAPGDDGGWLPPGTKADGPLVVVSMGTTPMDEAVVVRRVLDALDGAPVRVLVTLGPHLDDRRLPVPANATLSGYRRHAALLPHAGLSVNHGGLGTIGAALACGVPMVCLPLGRDQPSNAEAAAAVGAARVLPPDGEPAVLRAAVLVTLADDNYRRAAGRLADEIAALEGPVRAAEAVEHVCVR
jgi:MGT family glycosyltransferase